MLQFVKTLHTTREQDSYSISVNTLINRISIDFSHYHCYRHLSGDFDHYLQMAFTQVRPYCSVIVDSREADMTTEYYDDFRFCLISRAISFPVIAYAEVVRANTPHNEALSDMNLIYPYEPLIKKFTTLHAAESWLNSLKIISSERELFY